jgi:DNA replication factor GINS
VYNQLYAAWKREIDDATLGGLPPDFYGKISDYLRRINEENKLDQKSVKLNLLKHENQNVELMLQELLDLRYKKIIKSITKKQRVPVELLTTQENKIAETFATFSEEYLKFRKDLEQGQIASSSPIKVVIKTDTKPSAPFNMPAQKRLTVRFVKNIPAIMGADMKSYGPFNAEDVASLPTLNAQILIKQGLAVLIEVS